MKKINIIDIALIVLIIALVVASYLKFGVYEHTKTSAELNKIEYSIKVSDVRNYTADAFKIGDTIFDSQTKLAIGKISNIEVENSKVNRETYDGRIVYAENTNRCNVTITVEAEGIENDNGYFADRSVELKVGSEKEIETKYVRTTGKIMSINTEI